MVKDLFNEPYDELEENEVSPLVRNDSIAINGFLIETC